jgi:hypothetical protein
MRAADDDELPGSRRPQQPVHHFALIGACKIPSEGNGAGWTSGEVDGKQALRLAALPIEDDE